MGKAMSKTVHSLVALKPRTAIALGVSLALWGAHVVAQETSALEEVIVTGSFIQGTPENAAQPVETITFEELQNVGRPSNLEMVKLMSEVGQVAGETDRYNSFPVGAATVNLRNLGQRFTTVIFNGRRFPEQFSPVTGRFNNIAWIPNAAVGGVEVLKGGGAVTYGADAVAGVVNYITRKDVDGLELNASYRYIEDSDGDYDVDALWGKTFDRGNLLLSAAYQHRSSVQAWDRDWARQEYMINNNGQTWGLANSPGSYAFQTQTTAVGAPATGVYSTINASPLQPAGVNRYVGERHMGASGIIRDNNCTELGGFSGWSGTPTPACYFQQTQFEKLVEESDTVHLYAELNYDITDSIQYTGEYLAYDITLPDIAMHPSDGPLSFPLAGTAAQSAAGTSAYYVPGSNPSVAAFLNQYRNSDGTTTAYTPAQIDAIVNGGRAALPFGLWRPFAIGGNPLYGAYDVQENSTRFYRTTQAIGGDLPEFGGSDMRWDVALTYNHVKDRREARDMLVDRLQAALNGFGGPNCTGAVAGANGCQWFNPFSSSYSRNYYTGESNSSYVPGLENNLDLVRWLYVPISLEREYKYFVADLLFSGKTGFELPGGPMAIAVGAQYRRATEKTDLSDLANRDINPCATAGVTNCASRTGPLAFTRNSTVLGATLESERKFPVYAAFAEAQLPLLDSLTLQFAGRYEKFISDLSDKDNDIFVPAASLRWQSTDWLAIRGSWGRTFSQVNPPAPTQPVIANSTANATFGGIGGTGTGFQTANYPNLDVEPMKGQYVNLGFLFEAGGFQSSLDLYEVRIDDFARTMSTTNVISGLIQPGTGGIDAPINCSSALLAPQAGLGGRSFVELNGPCTAGSRLNSVAGDGGLGGGRINYFGGTDETNAGELRTRGIDLTMSYAFENVLGGRLRPSIDGSYVLDWELEDFAMGGATLARGYDGVGFVNNTSTGRIGQAVPEWRGTLGLNYNRDIHNLNIAARFLPSIKDEDPVKFGEGNRATNANIGDANGFTTVGGACADTDPSSPPIPAGSGTGEFGSGNSGAPATVGYCQAQVARLLSGQEIDSSITIDMTYRVLLPTETTIAFSIFNLTDEEPSFARTAISYMSGFGSPLGRNFKLQLTQRF
jgi:iron complex outermembrane receptor protein